MIERIPLSISLLGRGDLLSRESPPERDRLEVGLIGDAHLTPVFPGRRIRDNGRTRCVNERLSAALKRCKQRHDRYAMRKKREQK